MLLSQAALFSRVVHAVVAHVGVLGHAVVSVVVAVVVVIAVHVVVVSVAAAFFVLFVCVFWESLGLTAVKFLCVC